MSVRSEDVAQAAGVSRATVSQILNGRGARFAEQTRARVLRIAADLDYRPSVAARALATGTSDIVVALLPFTYLSGNLQVVLEKAADELAQRGLTLVLRQFASGTQALRQLLTSLRPRAVLSLQTLGSGQVAVLDDLEIPHIAQTTDDEVSFGFDERIGRAQARHLASRGFRQLAYVHLDDERFEPWGRSREDGVSAAAGELGLGETLVRRARLDPRSVADVVESLPDGVGVACYNDDLAIALLSAAVSAERRVPEQLGLIGMDATPLSACTIPALTTLSIDVHAAASNMIDGLLAILSTEGGASPMGRPVELTVIERGST